MSFEKGTLKDVLGKGDRLLVGNISQVRFALLTVIDHQRHAKKTNDSIGSSRALIDNPNILTALQTVNLHPDTHDPVISLCSAPRLEDY